MRHCVPHPMLRIVFPIKMHPGSITIIFFYVLWGLGVNIVSHTWICSELAPNSVCRDHFWWAWSGGSLMGFQSQLHTRQTPWSSPGKCELSVITGASPCCMEAVMTHSLPVTWQGGPVLCSNSSLQTIVKVFLAIVNIFHAKEGRWSSMVWVGPFK